MITSETEPKKPESDAVRHPIPLDLLVCEGHDAYRAKLREHGVGIDRSAEELLRGIPSRERQESLKVEIVSVGSLGFPGGANMGDIVRAAHARGLALCSSEVGPALAFTNVGLPADGTLTVAMKPMDGTNGNKLIFRFDRSEDGARISAVQGSEFAIFAGHRHFVFLIASVN